MRGGKRPGAGRKKNPNKKQTISPRIDPRLKALLKEEKNQALVIEKALCAYYNIDLNE